MAYSPYIEHPEPTMRQIPNHVFNSGRATIIPVLVCLMLFPVPVTTARTRDTVTITSDKTAVVDKTKGTAVWQKNVRVIRTSTGSNLRSDRLSIKRDLKGKRINHAEALGNVKAVFHRQSETGSTPLQVSKSIVTCDRATFDRDSSLAELSGNVHVQTPDFELQADRLRYNIQTERGKITASPGQQVRILFYKKQGPSEPETNASRSETQKITGLADEILVDRPAHKSVLQGKVLIIDHSDQSEFKADRAELFFDDLEEIETIVASGRFSMKQPKRLSKAERAVFEYATEEVTLIGDAYVKEDDNMEVSSARIKMYMKVNRGIISGFDDVPVKMKIEIK